MKKAFTTAELLISLVIIGAIASLVVPTIVKDYNTRIRTAAIKDNYANIMAAIERACADENVTYFSKTGYMQNGNSIKEFMNKYIRGVEKNSFAAGSVYRRFYNGNSYSPSSVSCNANLYCYTMQSGAALKAECNPVSNKPRCTFYIDTNGKGEPNRGGVDMFSFIIGADSNDPIVINSTVCRNSALGTNCINQLLINDWDLEKLWTETSAPRW